MARSLFLSWGSFAWTRNERGIRRGVLKLTEVLARAEKYDCNRSEWVRTPCHPRPCNRSHEILHSNGSPVNEIVV